MYKASKAEVSETHFLSPGRIFQFLTPLRIFFPSKASGNNPSKITRDWNLSFLALAYGFAIMMIGSYPYKLQYASLTFGWTSEALGYWMSVVGISRALYLTLLLPLVISFFKPKPKPSIRLAEDSEPATTESSSAINDTSSETEQLLESDESGDDKHHHTPTFDLNIARMSIVVETTTYILMALTSSGTVFTVWTAMGSVGAGVSPAVQSLALLLYTNSGGTESGSLFGALSVVNALGAQIISPALFGLTYAATVGKFPQAIFITCAAALACSLLLLSLVRLPKAQPAEVEDGVDADHLRAETSSILEPNNFPGS